MIIKIKTFLNFCKLLTITTQDKISSFGNSFLSKMKESEQFNVQQ